MKRYLAICICALMIHCQAQKPALILTSATQQSWGGGAAGSGSGTNYTIVYSAVKAGQYRFAYLCTNGGVLTINTKPKRDSLVTLNAGESVTLTAQQYYPGDIDKRSGRDTATANTLKRNALIAGALPSVYNGKDVVIYYCNGRKQYFAIPVIKRLSPLNYP